MFFVNFSLNTFSSSLLFSAISITIRFPVCLGSYGTSYMTLLLALPPSFYKFSVRTYNSMLLKDILVIWPNTKSTNHSITKKNMYISRDCSKLFKTT
jgi:hypothetical protein